jgi:hypothetical protein
MSRKYQTVCCPKRQQRTVLEFKLRAKIRSKTDLFWQPHSTSVSLHGIRALGGKDLLISRAFSGQFWDSLLADFWTACWQNFVDSLWADLLDSCRTDFWTLWTASFHTCLDRSEADLDNLFSHLCGQE